MPSRLGRIEIPTCVVADSGVSDPNYGVFVVEPFEAGYGRTIGNAIRRVLLSSLEGASISAIKLNGALHEFCTLSGVVEDVTDMITNLKGVLVKMHSREMRRLTLSVKGPAEVSAGDIQTDGTVEILNPDHRIATLDAEGKLEAELEIRIGRGYCSAEGNKKENQEIGIIPIDSLFSPVRRVKYSIEEATASGSVDVEKLLLEVWTDGRVTPEDAVTQAAAILRHHLEVFVNYDKDLVEFEEKESQRDEARDELVRKLSMSVNEIELSVRAANCLNNANIVTVGELARKSEPEMLKYRNFGKKSLNEIKAKLQEMGLGLGMKFEDEQLP